jgi:mevalonate kinase
MSLNFFPSKILLFGEYSILNGSNALAIPFNDFMGEWSFETTDQGMRNFSRENLNDFLKRDWTPLINQEKFFKDFQDGLWFKSSIPQGFGLGSSGALVAGILQRYGAANISDSGIKNALATLEGHFHGSSSGLDPLVSYLKKPLKIYNFNHLEILEREVSLKNFFLVNTKTPRKTGPLVEIYKEKLKDSLFQKTCVMDLSFSVNSCIDSYLSGDQTQFKERFCHISQIQWNHFQEMIPLHMREIWTIGRERGDYFLKLCGAGGGGFLLGYSLNPLETQKMMESHSIDFRWLT